MATIQTPPATLADLMRTQEKAELIHGRIVPLMPTGRRPHRIAFRIARALDDYAVRLGVGEAYGDNMGFIVPLLPSGRESFSPDAAYHTGPFPADAMRFIEAAPTFAVEVRSENDYGPSAEVDMAAKRVDYFLAGTLAVWDVDPIAETVTLYRANASTQSVVFRRGDVAEAEPAVPGWRMTVDEVFAA
jgi:Uma2 family endonuclease